MKRRKPSVKQEQHSETCSPVIKSEFVEEELPSPSDTTLMLQMLSRIEERQIQQQNFLEQMSFNKRMMGGVSSSSESSPRSYESPDDVPSDYQVAPSSRTFSSPGSNISLSFSEQFLQLMSVFSQMSEEDKQDNLFTIRNFADEKQQQSMVSLLDSIRAPIQSAQNGPDDLPLCFNDDGDDGSSVGLF